MDSGVYTTKALFEKDYMLIINNCKSYNPPHNQYYLRAVAMEGVFHTYMQGAGLEVCLFVSLSHVYPHTNPYKCYYHLNTVHVSSLDV